MLEVIKNNKPRFIFLALILLATNFFFIDWITDEGVPFYYVLAFDILAFFIVYASTPIKLSNSLKWYVHFPLTLISYWILGFAIMYTSIFAHGVGVVIMRDRWDCLVINMYSGIVGMITLIAVIIPLGLIMAIRKSIIIGKIHRTLGE